MSVVQDIITASNTRSSDAITSAQVFITALETLAESYEDFPAFTYSFQDIDTPSLDITSDAVLQDTTRIPVASPPMGEDVASTLWNKISYPDFNDAAPVSSVTIPEINDLPDIPTAFDTSKLNDLEGPTITESELPELNLVLPSLIELDVPDIPLFDIEAPELNFVAPSNNFEFHETDYESTLGSAVTSKLIDDIENGGYGINTNDEQALYDRALEREENISLDAEKEIAAVYAAKGFPIPPGAALANQQKVLEKRDANLSTLNRDIYLKRSELYQQNYQFTLTQSIAWEQAFINLHNAKIERALNYERLNAEFGLKYFNAQVDIHNLKIKTYQTSLVGFKTRLDLVTLNLEYARTRIAALSSNLALNSQIINKYNAELSGVKTLYEFYNTQMRAVQLNVDVENKKLDAHKTEITRYLTNLNTKTVELDHYKSQISGAKLRLDDFKAIIDGYKAKNSGLELNDNSESKRLQSDLDIQKTQFSKIQQDLDKYKTDINASVSDSNIKDTDNVKTIQIWQALLNNAQIKRNVNLKVNVQNQIGRIEILKLQLQQLKEEYDNKVRGSDVQVSASSAGISLYENLIAGAESSLNAIAHLTESATS